MKLMDRLGGRMDNKPPVSVEAAGANGIGEADSMQRPGYAKPGLEPSVDRTSDAERSGVGGVFSECRAKCPYRRDVPNGAGGTEHDCAHRENSPHLPIDQTPCDERVCPLFTSDDPEGDEENMRYAHEVEGRYWLPAGGGGAELAANYKTWETKSGAASQTGKISSEAAQ